MTDSPIEKAAALVVLAFCTGVLLITPWPDIDQLLGSSPAEGCLLLPKPHPDCPPTNGRLQP